MKIAKCWRKASEYLLWIGLVLMLGGCSCQHSGGSSVTSASQDTTVSSQSIAAFQSTLYAFGQTQGCVKCHSSTVSPEWMNVDVTTAYAFARPLVDFSNPTVSIFAVYAGNNHCNDPVCAVAANSAVVLGLLTQWSEVELTQNSSGAPVGGGNTLANPPFFTATLPIPTPLPIVTTATPAVVRFDLSQLSPPVPSLNGAILEISIQSYNAAANEYKIFNPRIAGNSSTITVNGIHVYVRPATGTGIGTEYVNQGDLWSQVQAAAMPSALPGTLPTGPLTAVPPLATISIGIPVQSTADVITIGFQSIQ